MSCACGAVTKVTPGLRRLADTIDEMEKAGEIDQETYDELDDVLWQLMEAAGLDALPPSPVVPMRAEAVDG